MSELMIAVYPTEAAATEARDALLALQVASRTAPEDIVMVFHRGPGEIRLRHTVWRDTGKPLGDGRWGMLIGSLFLDDRDPKKERRRGLLALFRKAGLDTDFLRDVSRSLHSGSVAVGMRLHELSPKAAVDRLARLGVQGRILRAELSAEVEADLETIRDVIPDMTGGLVT